ncbi:MULTISPECIES: DUF4330 family protein [Aneurinibacillus]|uniref:DUF4330 domain-containing protein n=1 Tax=Aneurinibacillus thermoaerophilus TaxID=143495 RepID=A0A1G8D849_ANETH|nr:MULTISPECIES: DUF4330 family protein [Aneurinibacillus]AMA72034.1 hypothetical protein ACH33_03700 [Aneurinibacillus sp. XH2]MED0677004.1 DUF4330 family protein [Aneurinibacillus thermoaerophilus]MED0679317.1 DUF4330 family protein [Aneurinibacillus thermoaerophilus]MED0737203.1 DUF4330 family protein [Aneurinibacillus thermoaerophilus]MED0757249.1 DUF4330 family protein [Aneurinibacillus thermoaerophilus]
MNARAFSFTLKDALITLLLIAAAIIISLKASMAGKLIIPSKEMTVVLRIEGQEPSFHKSIKPGDKIFQKGQLEPFGTVVDVKTRPAEKYLPDVNGNYYLRSFDAEEDVYLTIKAPGFVSLDGRPIIDNTFFHANLYLPAHTNQAVFASRVISVK